MKISNKKSLEQMSLTELWQLFPIILTPPKTIWTEWYKAEAKIIVNKLSTLPISSTDVYVNHIGSTAIGDIWAKPTIDILLEISPLLSIKKIAQELCQTCGYIIMCEKPTRIDLNKGYTIEGFAERVFHLHLRFFGDNDELYFRDYLKENRQVAKEYEILKKSLATRFKHNRDSYTDSKSDFVKTITTISKQKNADRYKRS